MPIRVVVQEAIIEFESQRLISPLIISSGAIEELTEVRAKVRCSVNGIRAEGWGATYLSDVWAWPDPDLSHAERDTALRAMCEWLAGELPQICGRTGAHPLELGMKMHEAVMESHAVCDKRMPPLARAMCVSPFDAAVHDATGLALRRSAFQLYEEHQPMPAVDSLFAPMGACAAISRMLRKPVPRLPAWLIVGKNDDLDRDLRGWIRDRRYRCFKIKLQGRDNAEDVRRTVDVYHAAVAHGVAQPLLSGDTNEANPSADSVEDYLRRLQEADRFAFEALQYLEQPTSRDIERAAWDWRRVAAMKPVLLDEGLTDLERIELGLRQGWSGFALKTCKGHSFALVAAAWGYAHGMSLAVQDLTNPGYALVHAALFAAHIPSINGVELNSPQFTPAANRAWVPRWRELFEPQDGEHHIPMPVPYGLGSALLES